MPRPYAVGATLADVQASQTQVGRIRMGTSAPKKAKSGKEFNEPVKLDRFRFTSRSRQLIQSIAAEYGGEVGPWEPQSGGAQQWEVIVTAESIPVIVPPNALTQYYELWEGPTKCTRRCDGEQELISGGDCLCDPDRRACKPTTRVTLMLSNIAGMGVWRLDSHGNHAARELPAVTKLVTAAGGYVDALLEMEDRRVEIPNPKKQGEMMMTDIKVPMLHVQLTPRELVAGFAPRAAIEAPDRTERPAITGRTEAQVRGEEYYLDRIAEAATREAMMQLRTQFRADFPEVRNERLETAWTGRANELVAQTQPAAEVERVGQSGAPEEIAHQARLALIADIGAASTDEELKKLWVTGMHPDVSRVWFARREEIAEAADPAPRLPEPEPEPAAVQKPPPGQDRRAVWQQILTWGGFNNKKLSDLASMYHEFADTQADCPTDHRTASAEQLWAFGLSVGALS